MPKSETITINKKMLLGIAPAIPIIAILLSKNQPGPLLLFFIGISCGVLIGIHAKVKKQPHHCLNHDSHDLRIFMIIATSTQLLIVCTLYIQLRIDLVTLNQVNPVIRKIKVQTNDHSIITAEDVGEVRTVPTGLSSFRLILSPESFTSSTIKGIVNDFLDSPGPKVIVPDTAS